MAFGLNLGNLEVHLLANTKALQRGLKNAEAMLDRTSRKMKNIGRTMSMYVTAPLALIGGFSVKAFANFDDAMTQSLAIMGDVSKEMRTEMENVAKSIAKKSITSATELAEAYYFLASAGMSAQQSIKAIGAIEKFAVAGRFDMATATELAMGSQAALNLTVKDAEQNMKNTVRITDLLVGANTLAQASVREFATALTSKAAAAISNWNIKLEEGIAVLAVYAKKGIKAEYAGNMFSRMIKLSMKSVIKNRKEWEKLNITFEDVAGNLDLVNMIKGITKATKGMGSIQKAATIQMLGFQAKSVDAILPLLGMSNTIKEFEKRLLSFGGITKKVADKQLKSFSSQMKILWNNVKIVGIEIGLILAPYIILLGGYLQKAINWFQTLDKSTRKWIVAIGIAVASIGPLLIGLSMIIVLIKFVVIGFLTWVPIVVVGLAIAASIWDINDALTNAGLKVLEWVENFRIGGIKIKTWMTALGSVIWQTWDWAVSKIKIVWGTLVLSVKEAGTKIWRIMLRVIKLIDYGFWTMALTINKALAWVIQKAVYALSWLKVISNKTEKAINKAMKARTGKIKEQRDNSAEIYEMQIKKSLENSLDRWKKYFGDVDSINRKYAKQKEKWENVRNTAFAKDYSEGVEEGFIDRTKKELERIKNILNMDVGGVDGITTPDTTGTGGVSMGSFKEMSLRRFDISSPTPAKTKKQEVQDVSVANKLDQLIQISNKKAGAVLG